MNFLVDAFKRALDNYSNAIGFKWSSLLIDGENVIELRNLPIRLDNALVKATFNVVEEDSSSGKDTRVRKNVCEPKSFKDGENVIRIILDYNYYANKINMVDSVIKKYMNS